MELLRFLSDKLSDKLSDIFIPKPEDIVAPTKEEWELICEVRALGKAIIKDYDPSNPCKEIDRRYQEVHTIRVTRSTKTGELKRDVNIEWSNNTELLKTILTKL